MSETNGSDSSPQTDPSTVVRVLEICNKKGLHARASAKFVQTVEKFDANVRVTRGGETVGGDSIMGLMMLAAGPGTTIFGRGDRHRGRGGGRRAGGPGEIPLRRGKLTPERRPAPHLGH